MRPVSAPLIALAACAAALAQPPALPTHGGGLLATKPTADEVALAAAKLSATDGKSLRAYLTTRTVTEADRGRIAAVISRLGSEDFAARLAAEREAEALGPAAFGALRAAASDKEPVDYEVAYRAGLVLKRVEKVPHAAVARAAVAALGRAGDAENAKVLLDFLPCAADADVAGAIRASLGELALRGERPGAGVVAGLSHPAAKSRAAAAVALVGEPGREAVRVPAALGAVRAALAREPDAGAAFDMLFGLAAVAEDPNAVGELVGKLAELPRGRLWRAEDFLLQLAGPAAPGAKFGKTPQGRLVAQDAWVKWWAGAQSTADWAKFRYTPRTTGRLLTVTFGTAWGQSGKVTGLGDDSKDEWTFAVPGGVYDAHVGPDGAVVTAEQGVTELRTRTTAGMLVSQEPFVSNGNALHALPMQIGPGPTGTLTVACRDVVLEVGGPKPGGAGNAKPLYQRPQNHDIATACRLADGRTVALIQNPPLWLVVVDAAGKVEEPVKAENERGVRAYHLSESGPNRVLLTDASRVVEYDLASGKEVWAYPAANPKFAQRLANGNTLVVAGELRQERLAEVSPAREVLWEFKPPEGDSFMRAYRR